MPFRSVKPVIEVSRHHSKKQTQLVSEILKIIANSLQLSMSDILMIDKILALREQNNSVWELSPEFLTWLIETKKREVIIRLSTVLENRKKRGSGKTIHKVMSIARNNKSNIFDTKHFNVYLNDNSESKEEISVPSFEVVEQKYIALLIENKALIDDIITIRDDVIAHASFTKALPTRQLKEVGELVKKLIGVVNDLSIKIDRSIYANSIMVDRDFFNIIERVNR